MSCLYDSVIVCPSLFAYELSKRAIQGWELEGQIGHDSASMPNKLELIKEVSWTKNPDIQFTIGLGLGNTRWDVQKMKASVTGNRLKNFVLLSSLVWKNLSFGKDYLAKYNIYKHSSLESPKDEFKPYWIIFGYTGPSLKYWYGLLYE